MLMTTKYLCRLDDDDDGDAPMNLLQSHSLVINGVVSSFRRMKIHSLVPCFILLRPKSDGRVRGPLSDAAVREREEAVVVVSAAATVVRKRGDLGLAAVRGAQSGIMCVCAMRGFLRGKHDERRRRMSLN